MENPDFFYKRYENICIFGGFDNTPENSDMINFINDHCLMDFVKKSTCFKSAKNAKNDLFLKANRFFFSTNLFF